ncbi:MAG: phosphoribosylaminoimidazolesuccinocarboxamide synthase [Flavobacteriaceae bacterium]|nr:phosphoribosylaminoimidazolesuccinocarboxamide synthase [Flavobacteriaceae bacterium]|tara:strand:+ start:471 stop:1412 length:942 start_codon:yes stop_codon:yes gene_type:complete
MNKTLFRTNFKFKNQLSKYTGKVRELYKLDNGKLIMISTDKISAFDFILPKGIPYKGQILNQIATRMMSLTSDIVPNWILDSPDPNVSVGLNCDPFKIEMVIRGYLAGHAAREYKKGKRLLCGVKLPNGLSENDKLPYPIITPATKADHGHDEDISEEDIINKSIISESDYEILKNYTLKLFERGTKLALNQNLILVDTKYEFGRTADGKIILIDEVHTPDSSRYFYKDGYEKRQKDNIPQKQLSKEFVREWLISNNFQGLRGQTIPHISDEYANLVSERYIELYERIMGEPFIKEDINNIEYRIKKNLSSYL